VCEYFGKVEISETVTFRIDDGSYVPKGPSYEAQHPIPEDSTSWEKEALLDGSPPNTPMRPEFKTMMGNEVRRVLDKEGYVFNDDGNYVRTYHHCRESICLMTANEYMVEIFDAGREAHEECPNNIRRKEAYHQMALTINGGPTGAGNRVELPACVLSGIRSMFPDADGQYMGHRDA
jgi:hypothetical protein